MRSARALKAIQQISGEQKIENRKVAHSGGLTPPKTWREGRASREQPRDRLVLSTVAGMQVLRAVLLLAAAAAAAASDSHGRQPIADEHLVSHFLYFFSCKLVVGWDPKGVHAADERDEICTFSRSMASLCVPFFTRHLLLPFTLQQLSSLCFAEQGPDSHTQRLLLRADNLSPAHFCA